MCNSLQAHGPYSPWNSPGQNTAVGSRSLLQGIFPTQGSNPGLHIASRFFTSWATRDTHPYLDAFFFFFLPDCSKWSCKNTNQIVLLVRLNPKHQNPSQGLMTLGVLVHVCSLTVRLCTTTVALRVPATLVFYSSCSLCFFSTSGSSDLQFLWCKRLLSSPLPLLNSYFSFSFQLEYHLFTNTFPDLLCFSAGHIHRVMALCFVWLHIYCHCRGL